MTESDHSCFFLSRPRDIQSVQTACHSLMCEVYSTQFATTSKMQMNAQRHRESSAMCLILEKFFRVGVHCHQRDDDEVSDLHHLSRPRDIQSVQTACPVLPEKKTGQTHCCRYRNSLTTMMKWSVWIFIACPENVSSLPAPH